MQVCKGDVFGFLGRTEPARRGDPAGPRPHPSYERHAEVCGHRVPGELQGALRHVGGFVDDPTFYPLMSARRNLRLLAA